MQLRDLTVGVSLCVTSSVSAQTPADGGSIAVNLVAVDGTPYTDISLQTEIGDAACRGGAGTITVSLNGVPNRAAFPHLQAWLATGIGDCNDAARSMRLPDSNNCTQLELKEPDASCQGACQNIEVTLGDTCASDGPHPIYFLVLPDASDQDAANYGVLTIRVDTTPPEPAQNVKGGTGAAEISITWDEQDDVVGYYVMLDTTVGYDCSSSLLSAGAAELDPNNLPGDTLTHIVGQSVTQATFEAADFHGKTQGAAAVIAEDRAGNLSKLSDVVCLKVEPKQSTPPRRCHWRWWRWTCD